MSGSKSQDKTVKKMNDADRKKAITAKKDEIIKHCKNLATFKVSSAVHINEATKELLRLESGAE